MEPSKNYGGKHFQINMFSIFTKGDYSFRIFNVTETRKSGWGLVVVESPILLSEGLDVGLSLIFRK